MMPECYRCGRAIPEVGSSTGYVFGRICDRTTCQRVKLALSKRWQTFWFKACLPGPDWMGRAAAFGMDGSYNYPSGMGESSLNTLHEANRMRDETQEATTDA